MSFLFYQNEDFIPKNDCWVFFWQLVFDKANCQVLYELMHLDLAKISDSLQTLSSSVAKLVTRLPDLVTWEGPLVTWEGVW